MRTVLVLNHFAAPRDAPGGTRHVELVSGLSNWKGVVIAANRNYFTRRRVAGTLSGDYRTVWTSGYRVNGLARILNWTTYAISAFIAGLRVRDVQVVYASTPHLLTGLTGWALARVRRAAFVLEVRDLWPRVLVDMGEMRENSAVYRALQGLERFLYHHADAVVAMTPGVVRVLVDDQRVPPERVHLIPNGADPTDFDCARSRKQDRLDLGLSGTVIAYTGAHGPANGLDLVLDAAAMLATEQPDLWFVLVGDGVAKPDLQAAARRRQLRNVEFRDPIPKSQMPALLHAADVGLHVLADVDLFRYGVSPNKLFDYMAAGLPVITNTTGEVADVVTEAGAGICCPPGGLAEAVRTMVAASPEQRRAWGLAGRTYVGATRSRTAMAARLTSLLDQVSA